MDLNEQAKIVHEANAKWWHDLDTGERLERNKGELLMLCISEVAEAMEGERKNLADSHLKSRPMAEVEMADVLIRLLDFAGGFGYELRVLDGVDRTSENKGEALLAICDGILDIYWTDILDPSDVGQMISQTIASIYAYCVKFGYDLEGAYHEKLAYNRVRADHKVEARKAVGGKRW